MPTVINAPDDLRIAPNNLGTPAVAGAFGPDGGVVVAAGQQGIRHALARFGPDLSLGDARVIAADGDAAWWTLRLAPLPDGRFLLCAVGRGPNLYVDGALAVAPADDLAGVAAPGAFSVSERDTTPRDAFTVGDRLVLGHSSHYSNVYAYQRLSAAPKGWPRSVGDGSAAEPWLHDLGSGISALVPGMGSRWHAHHRAVVTGAGAGDWVGLAGMGHLRSGSTDHGFVAVGADGAVRRAVRADRALIRDEALALAGDRGRLLVAATGTLAAYDDRLEPVAGPVRHPFLDAFRLLAGDGSGTLLWYAPKRHLLLLSAPDELPPDLPAAALSGLLAAADAVGPARTARRTAGAARGAVKARRVERHLIDTSTFADALAGDRQRLIDLMAGPPPARLYPLPGLARDVLARASVVDREDTVIPLAARALAQGLTGQVLADVAQRRGEAGVAAPFGDGTATLDADQRLGSVSTLTWRDAWYAAVVAGEERCLDALAAVDAADLDSGVAHGVAWMAALKAYRADPATVGPAVDEAVAAGAPEQFRTTFQYRMHVPHLAVYPVLAAVAGGDPAAVNAALLAALKTHKKSYGSRSESHNSGGWVALGPQAMCRLARDRGIDIAVESDYLLPSLHPR